jgi:addiction module HigA family antidote
MDRLPPIHPGEVLWEDFMKPLRLSQYRVAKDIGVPQLRISQIIKGKRAVTADTAMRLARYFGTSAEVWLRLQARYDLEVAEGANGKRIDEEVRPLAREEAPAELRTHLSSQNERAGMDNAIR